MRTLQFNFNNDVNTFTIYEEEDGTIRVPLPGGDEATYANRQQFAEMYAQARDVTPDNLKNWKLVENGDVLSFILRAGTAGVSAAEIQEQMDQVFGELRTEGAFHPLDVERVRQEVAGSRDVMQALVGSANLDVARVVYDRLNAMGAFTEPEQEPEEVDERSEMEKYLDSVLEQDRTLAFFAQLFRLEGNASREQVVEALHASTIPYTVAMLSDLYEDAIRSARANGINVTTRMEALLVVGQEGPDPDEDAKRKLLTAATLAGRDKVNVTSYTVGHSHIRKSATLMRLEELDAIDVFMSGNTPIVVSFDPAVDEELEREREEAEAEANAGNHGYDTYDDDYDEDYDEDYDGDDDDYDGDDDDYEGF